MKNFLVALIVLNASRVFAAEAVLLDFKAQSVTIGFESEAAKRSPNGLKLWKGICKRLGKSLLNKSVEGGSFTSYGCVYQKALGSLGKASQWIVAIKEEPETLNVDVYFQSAKESVVVKKMSLPYKGDFLKYFKKNTKVTSDLARLIIEDLPTGVRLVYKGTETEFNVDMRREWLKDPQTKKSAKGAAPASGIVALPPYLTVYRLGFDPESMTWHPQITAKLKFVREEKGKKGGFYSLDTSFAPLVKGETYWVKQLDEDAHSERRRVLTERVEWELKNGGGMSIFDRLLFESLSSNYVGLRLGKSLLVGDTIVARSSMMSLLVEMRGGPLAGMRWYYDYMPKVSRHVGEFEEHFSMNRISLGWAFDFMMPESWRKIIARVDVQPKIGLFDLDYVGINSEADRDAPGARFKAENKLDLSFEVGIEREATWMRNRLWASYNSAKFGLQEDAKFSVTSQKAGIDAYFNIWQAGDIKAGLMAFGLLERITLAREPEAATNDSDLLGLGFNLFFAGGGFTLSW